MPSRGHAAFVILVAIVLLVSGALRIREAQKSFWLDELHTTELAHGTRADMLSILAEEVHAPLFYVLVSFADTLGASGHALRTVSVLIGLMGFLPLLLILRALETPRSGVVAAVALYGLAPFQLRYQVELRPYVLLQTLALFLVWAAFCHQGKARLRFWVFAGCSALALLTHYLAAAVIVGVGAGRLLFRPAESLPLKQVVLAGSLGVLVFIPWVMTMENWLFTDPEALVRADDAVGPRRPRPGFQELRGEVASILPRTLVPGAESLLKPQSALVRIGLFFSLLAMAIGVLTGLKRLRSVPRIFWGTALAAGCAAFPVGLLCVRFWHRIPIQYFVVLAWFWPLLGALVMGWLVAPAWRKEALGILLTGLLLAGWAEATGAPRENLQEAVQRAVAMAEEEGAHLTAMMRQPRQYHHTELFKAYGIRGPVIEPQAVPPADGRPVVVITRRLPLEIPGEGRRLALTVRSGRSLASHVKVGRAVGIYLFRPSSSSR